MRKRIYSILLAIAMLATIIPITVLAEDPPHTHNGYTAISNATELAALFTNGGSGYLTTDITTNSDASRLIKAGKTVNLCLNGFVLTLGNNNGQNIGIEGNGVLNLYDCGTKTHKFSVGANGLWTLDETSGTETVTGGVITGGQGGGGIAGAVYMASGAQFNMYGGNIIGNQASGNCGAVYVDGASIFNMSGGTIAGNIAGGLSGAIHITANAVFNLSGGTIDSNKSNSWGGAVCSYGTFNMTGGAITNNTSTQGGGGISISDNSTFSMSGGEISGCISGNEGGGACIGRDGVNLSIGGTAVITGNKRNSTTENLYLRTGGTSRLGVNTPAEGMSVGITMQTPGQFTNTTATSSDEQYFTSDNTSYFVSFNSGNYLELLSGTPVAQIGGTKYTTLNAAIKAAGVVEEATDTNATTIKLLANITNEGVFTIGPEKTIQNIILDLNGFTISDTTATTSLFKINEKSKLTIDDSSSGKTGAITAKGNTTKSIRGFDVDKSTLVLNNGKISDFSLENTEGLTGAGVSVWTNGTFIMNGGEISNCTAERGGAVDTDGTFIMTGGTITNNTASKNGGGIATSVNITIGGTANVTGNKVGENDNNLYLETGRQIILNTPASGMSVGVTMQTPGQFTTTSATSGDEQYFTSDDTAYAVAYKPDGFLKLELTYTVTYDGNGATSGEVVDNNKYVSGDQFTVLSGDSLVREGYTFTTWNRAADGSDYEYNPGKVQGINGNITLYAQWTKNPAPKPDPKPTPEPEPINYRITQGANSIWVIAAGESPAFRSNAPFEKFSHVLLDGKELAKKYYKAESGSTLITLTPEFTATLSVGKHTIEIVSTDGSASTVFYIEETIANTNGEGFALSTATMSSAFIGCNIVGLAVVFFELKKKKKIK